MRLFGVAGNCGRSAVVAGALVAAVGGMAAPALADEISITIEHIRALDKIDATGQADFYAHVTIDGKVYKTTRVRGADDIRPNWVISANVPPGRSSVNVGILDKDVFKKDDLVDINRVSGKRDLDFSVDTRRCRVTGFSQTYGCREKITREGTENRKALITFHVDVRRDR